MDFDAEGKDFSYGEYYALAAKNEFQGLPGPYAIQKLRVYAETAQIDALEGCTFGHIVNYLTSGVFNARLCIAAADFCMTMQSLEEARAKGISGVEVARDTLHLYNQRKAAQDAADPATGIGFVRAQARPVMASSPPIAVPSSGKSHYRTYVRAESNEEDVSTMRWSPSLEEEDYSSDDLPDLI